MRNESKYGTPTKLRDGSWGVKVQSGCETGDTVIVNTRGGKSWESVVEKVLWRDTTLDHCIVSVRR